MLLHIFHPGVFGNTNKWHKVDVQETVSPHNQNNVR